MRPAPPAGEPKEGRYGGNAQTADNRHLSGDAWTPDNGGLAAALSTAAGKLLVITSSFAHDVYTRLINPNASEATHA